MQGNHRGRRPEAASKYRSWSKRPGRLLARTSALLLAGLLAGALPLIAATDDPPPDPAPAGQFDQQQARSREEAKRDAANPRPMEAQPLAIEGESIDLIPVGGYWVSQGPGPTINGQAENCAPNNEVVGAVHTVVAHPTNANILWVGAVNGGVWRTDNATAAAPNWRPLTDFFPGLSIGALEMDPTDGTRQTLVAGIGHTSAFADVGGPRTGLLRTTDGGNTWTMLGQADLSGREITGVAPRGNTILVSANGDGVGPGVYRSTDGGASFQLRSGSNGLANGPAFDLVGDPGRNDRFYVSIGGAGGGIFRTDDFGTTWVHVSDAAIDALIGANTNNIEMAVHDNFANGTNAVYVGVLINGQLAGFFRSADQGGSWTAMDLPRTNEGGQPWGLQPTMKPGGQGAIHFSIVADRINANVVYVGGDRQPRPGPDGVERTPDDAWPNSLGANNFSGRLFRGDASVAPTGGFPSPQWTPLTHSGTASGSSPHADSRDMVFDANGQIIEVDDGGIYRRTSPTDAAGDWFSLNSNARVTEFHDIVYDTNANIIMGGAQDTGTHEQSAPGAAGWVDIQQADGGDVAVDVATLPGFSIRYWSSQNLGGFKRKACDAANACGAAALIGLNVVSGDPLGVQFVTPVELNAVTPSRLILGGLNSVYESSDLGDNIAELDSPGVNSNAMVYGHPSNADLIVIGSGNQVFVRTVLGAALAATPAAFPGGIVTDVVVDPADIQTMYVTDDQARVFQTVDGGATWAEITGNIAAKGAGTFQTVEYIQGSTSDVLLVGTNAGVMAAVEPQFSCWFEIGGGLPNAMVWDLDYDAADDVLVAGTMGRGAWTLSGLAGLQVPVITVPGGVHFDDTCVGTTGYATLEVCNTGTANLQVTGIASSDPQFAVTTPSSGYPVVISPDFCFPFEVGFTPAAAGAQAATFTIRSNAPCQGELEVDADGTGTVPRLATVMADAGSYGNVCLGSFKDLDLTLSNSGGCALTVTGVTSSSPEFQIPSVVVFPIVVAPGDAVAVPVRLAPASLGAKAATITVASDDPAKPSAAVPVTGVVPPGDVRVTGSTDFGDVCAGTLAEKTLDVCNVGLCNLAVTSVAFDPACADFTLINNPFPATVSPDSCQSVVIRFTPTSVGPKACSLKIVTDDPDTPVITKAVTGNTPQPMIDVPPDQGFAPTVIQSVGACRSAEPFPVSNTGICPLRIVNFAITDNAAEYSISGLPSFPILLEQGHIAGEGNLNHVFEPDLLDRDRTGGVTVTYVSDPITGATTSVTRSLCGEGVRTGARVLVRAGGVPLATVKNIKLQRLNANRNKNLLDSIDQVRDVPLMTVMPAAPCYPFQYHREYGTVSNPIQLAPGSYQVTVTVRLNGSTLRKTVGFDVGTCDFNPTIVVDF